MGDLRQIDPLSNEVLQELKQRLEDAQKGEIDGLIMISVYKSGAMAPAIKGAFSPDVDDYTKLMGMLWNMGLDLRDIVNQEDDDYE
jgi:hypothetical protein